MTVCMDAASPDAVAMAGEVLRGGGLVAFPTETVYGLGADARSAEAVARIFRVKGRPADDPIIVHVLDADGLVDRGVAASWPSIARRLAEAFWPGPLTLVVPRGAAIPAIVTAGGPSVAVRAPAHPVARALLAAFKGPIAAPSANAFGRTSPTTAAHVRASLGDAVDVILDGGPCAIGVESTVVDCTTTPIRILRPGGIAVEDIRTLAPDAASSVATVPTASPGTYPRHYAPRARLVLVAGADDVVAGTLSSAAKILIGAGRRVGLLVADEDRLDALDDAVIVRLAPLGDPSQAAHRLFAALHELDAMHVDIILARDWPPLGLGLAVSDRLHRAAEGRVVVADGSPATAIALAIPDR